MFALNLFDTQAGPAPGADPNRTIFTYARSPAHDALARDLAQASITLLKNDGLLPIAAAAVRTVAVFGDEGTIAGGGSGSVVCPYVITPTEALDGLLNGLTPQPPAPHANCTFEAGVDYFGQRVVGVRLVASAQACCDACGTVYNCHAFSFVASNSTCFFKMTTGGPSRPDAAVTSGNCTIHPPGPPEPPPSGRVAVTYYATRSGAAAAAAAAAADLAVVIVATDSGEGADRVTMGFPSWMDDLVFNVTAANKNTVVVARCPGACTMAWAGSTRAILFELLAGQESGTSIANTIFGGPSRKHRVPHAPAPAVPYPPSPAPLFTVNNPSGKLPLTFPNVPPPGSQYPTDTWLSPVGGGPVIPESFPGTDRGRGFPEVDFAEELLMGCALRRPRRTRTCDSPLISSPRPPPPLPRPPTRPLVRRAGHFSRIRLRARALLLDLHVLCARRRGRRLADRVGDRLHYHLQRRRPRGRRGRAALHWLPRGRK